MSLPAVDPPAEWLTVEDAATRTHSTPAAVRKAISRGKLRAFKPGKRRLIRPEDLRKYVEGRAR